MKNGSKRVQQMRGKHSPLALGQIKREFLYFGNRSHAASILFVPALKQHQYRNRTRYESVASPSFATGTLNCAANAAVFLASKVDEIICQSPPIGSLTTTVIGPSL